VLREVVSQTKYCCSLKVKYLAPPKIFGLPTPQGKPFTLIRDQRSLTFMFDKSRRGKIRNAKIQAWRAKLGIVYATYRPGSENAAADGSQTSMICRPFTKTLNTCGTQLINKNTYLCFGFCNITADLQYLIKAFAHVPGEPLRGPQGGPRARLRNPYLDSRICGVISCPSDLTGFIGVGRW